MVEKQKKKIAVSINLDWPLRRYHEFFSGLQAYNEEHADWVLIWDHYPENALRRSKGKYYDGIIGRIKYDAHEEAKKRNIPMVNTWHTSTLTDLPSISYDFEEAGFIAAEHLLKRGFRNFVNINYRFDKSTKPFYEGMQRAIKPHNCPLQRHLISRVCDESSDMWNKFHKDFAKWLSQWQMPLGIACSISSIGPKITTRILEHGLRIPEDIAIITFNNDLTYCEGFSPKISSIDANHMKAGYEAARMMHKLLEGDELEKQHLFIKPGSVVARESTDTYAIDDPVVKKALRFIADNCNKNIQVVDVVDQVSVARRSLEIRFQKEIGHTIVDEINRLRITTLKRLLIETDEKISKLATLVGFTSPLHMRRAFSKYTGLTPGQFRKNNRVNE